MQSGPTDRTASELPGDFPPGPPARPHEIFRWRNVRQTLIRGLFRARDRFGGKTIAIIDADGKTARYNDLLLGAMALGAELARRTEAGAAVGVMLPTSLPGLISVYALSAYGRVPAMLNFTTGSAGLKSALEMAQIRQIITAHKFIEIAKLGAMVRELQNHADILYLEDIAAKIRKADKLRAAAGLYAPALVLPATRTLARSVKFRPEDGAASKPAARACDHPAVILFTSGTEGTPKGVVLSHKNILANVEQVRCHLELSSRDSVLNPLPMFHCFGLSVGGILPLMLGIREHLHPTPLKPHEIVRRIREEKPTVLLATDTFISQYTRAGAPGDLKSLRLAVCGAERVRSDTRDLLRRTNAIEILEGYGVTETAPVAAANQLNANHPGTVGHLMPEMLARLEKVPGIETGGRLFLKGPNVMLGYLTGTPGRYEPPPGGWYDTGDVVACDADAFITIKGRLKRFAKIGGEAISLAVVENLATGVWPGHAHAAVILPDGRKGEQILLLTTFHDADRSELVSWAKRNGVPDLAVPRKVIPVREIPLLGTGKTNYVAAENIAKLELAHGGI